MKKNTILLILCFLIIPFPCQGMKLVENFLRKEIIPRIYPKYPWNRSVSVKNFTNLKKHIDELTTQKDKNILVVWDIDDVLLDSLPLLVLAKKIDESYSESREIILHKMYDVFRQPLMDERIPDYIKKLQKMSHVKVICLTNSGIGPILPKQLNEDFRAETLKRRGLDFSDTFPNYKDYVLYTKTRTTNDTDFFKSIHIENNLVPLHRMRGVKRTQIYRIYDLNNPPTHHDYDLKDSFVFKNGILFANDFSKADVLNVFLNDIKRETEWKPNGIVFIDDRKEENIIPMKRFLKDKFLYKLIHDKRSKEREKDKENLKKQLDKIDQYIENVLRGLRRGKQKAE